MKTSIGALLSIGVLLMSCNRNAHLNSTSASHTDSYFMTQVAYANMSLAEDARLAALKTEHESLRALATELSVDYQGAYDELKEISKDLNLPIPSRLNREHLEEELKLLGYSGKEFDTAYIGTQIRNNLGIIDLLEAQANGGHDLFLRRYAVKYLTLMKEHVYKTDSVLEVINTRKVTNSSNEENTAVALGE